MGTTKRHHRRRRVSGIVHPKLMQTVEFILGAGAGATAAAFAKQAFTTAFPTAPLWVAGAVEAGLAAGAAAFMKQTPLIMGVEAGFGGMGIAFMLNESVISLPGISGVPDAPMGPGYINRTVNGYRGFPPRVMGNFSGGGAHVVNGLRSN